MVVVHREHGFRFAILTDDHDPPHVHVYGDGELKVNIFGPDGLPEEVYNLGVKANDRRRAMVVIRARQAEFMARWIEIHGDERNAE